MRNVLLQIRFKCLAFPQKCRQIAGNAISVTQISKRTMIIIPYNDYNQEYISKTKYQF